MLHYPILQALFGEPLPAGFFPMDCPICLAKKLDEKMDARRMGTAQYACGGGYNAMPLAQQRIGKAMYWGACGLSLELGASMNLKGLRAIARAVEIVETNARELLRQVGDVAMVVDTPEIAEASGKAYETVQALARYRARIARSMEGRINAALSPLTQGDATKRAYERAGEVQELPADVTRDVLARGKVVPIKGQ